MKGTHIYIPFISTVRTLQYGFPLLDVVISFLLIRDGFPCSMFTILSIIPAVPHVVLMRYQSDHFVSF